MITILREHTTDPYPKMYTHFIEQNTLMPNATAAVERVRRSYGKSSGIILPYKDGS